MVLRLITVGKISTWSREAYEHFSKMISKYARIEHIKLSTAGDLNREDAKVLKTREARNILKKILGEPVCLDRNGERMSSEEFAEFLRVLRSATFIIGGPLGLDESVMKKCRKKISLSGFTLSHEIAFVVLLEQIFRAFKISRGEKYHY